MLKKFFLLWFMIAINCKCVNSDEQVENATDVDNLEEFNATAAQQTNLNEEKTADARSGKPYWRNLKRMKQLLHAEPAGNTAIFRCNAEGEKPLRTVWYKNKQVIQKGDRIGGYKFRHNNQTLSVQSVVLSDKGQYRCNVSNSYGYINHTYELDVAERIASRPILQYGLPRNKTVHIGSDVKFRCEVLSDPYPHIEWYKHIEVNGSKTDAHGNPYVRLLEKAGVNTSDAEIRTLTLKNISYEDAGEYVCLAGNSIGISHASAWLTVIRWITTTEVNNETSTTTITKDSYITDLVILIIGFICLVLVIVSVLYLVCKGDDFCKSKDIQLSSSADNAETAFLNDRKTANES